MPEIVQAPQQIHCLAAARQRRASSPPMIV